MGESSKNEGFLELLGDSNLVAKLWHSTEFMPRVLELIYQENPQYFIDDVEEFIIHRLMKLCKNIPFEQEAAANDMPKCLHLAAFSPQIYEKLQEILVIYAKESHFDTRFLSLIPEILTQIHRNAIKNPLDLYPIHLQSLIVLLLNDPNDQLVDQVASLWIKIAQNNPQENEKLCVLFLPWLNKILQISPEIEPYFKICCRI